VPRLAEIQSLVRQAVVAGENSALEPLLAGGSDARKRFDIHLRNYEASLTNALLEKFPATVWLIGASLVSRAAVLYVHQHPPEAQCISEYGAGFPGFLSECPGAERVPYLRPFAELEWCLGQVAVSVEEPGILPEEISAVPAESLPDLTFSLQPGVRYVEAEWPVDELIKLYLAETAPSICHSNPLWSVWKSAALAENSA
jgi:hypothetical protein